MARRILFKAFALVSHVFFCAAAHYEKVIELPNENNYVLYPCLHIHMKNPLFPT